MSWEHSCPFISGAVAYPSSLEFLTEFISEEDFFPVRDLKKIGWRYMKSTFIFDLLTVVPFRYFMQNNTEAAQLVQLFKLLRLPRLFAMIEPKQFNNLVKAYYHNQLKRVMSNDDYKSEQLTDHNKIMRQIMLGYFFRIVRMVLVIFTISYFFGTIFFIVAWQIYEHYDHFDNEYNFFNKNSVNLKDKMDTGQYFDAMIAVVYFAFTTLSTVGYGDLKPITNTERMIGSFILLFGVAVFSFIMGNFIEMLMEFKIVTAENEDNANLTKWFGLLARFNKGRPVPKEMQFKIEEYFNYYWQSDKNYAMNNEADKRFLSELPKKIRVDVMLFYPHQPQPIDLQGLPVQEFPVPVQELLPDVQGRHPAQHGQQAGVEVPELGRPALEQLHGRADAAPGAAQVPRERDYIPRHGRGERDPLRLIRRCKLSVRRRPLNKNGLNKIRDARKLLLNVLSHKCRLFNMNVVCDRLHGEQR